jgi:hypothetical protein
MLRITKHGRISRGKLFAGLGSVVALLGGVAACQLIAGVESRDYDPIIATCSIPGLPVGSGPSIRFVNLVPTADVVDICVRASGTVWGRPIFRDGGTDCASQLSKDKSGNPGLVYTNVTTSFTAPAAKIDVKMIAAGGTCSATALTEGDGLTLEATAAVNTILRIGGANNVAESIVALPEADMANPSSTNIRFVHAMPGVGPLDFGLAKSPTLPTIIGTPIVVTPIPYGSTVGPMSDVDTTLEHNGYVALPSTSVSVAAAVDGGSGNAVLLQAIPNQNENYSLFAIGVMGDNAHPQQSLLCDETYPSPAPTSPYGSLLTKCTAGALPNLSVDVFNPALYGPNAPFELQRRPVGNTLIPDAINSSAADLLCLVEVDRLEDRQTIATATQATYPNQFMITTDATTQPTNPQDQNGQVPPAATVPPCGGSVPSVDVDAAFQCMEMYCSNRPNDPTGSLQTTTDCLSENCAGQILTVKADSSACYDCVIDGVVSAEPYGSTETLCESSPTASIGFDGQNSSMILSKFALTNTDSLVLPSTNYRRTILYAQVQLQDQSIDFYCGFLITTLIASDLPFVGPYGGGEDAGLSSQDEYNNEQDLQAQQLIAWVQQKSAGRPAILMGDWRSSVNMAGDGGLPPPQDLNPMAMNILANAPGFKAVNAPNFPPQCNYCPGPGNAYNGQDSYFVEQPFLYNWPDPTNAVTDESVIFTNPNVVTLPDGGGGPLSPYYGLNITVLRPSTGQ